MSKIVLTPNASGTGTFTIQSPATNTNRTFTLPDGGGELSVSIKSANDPAADSNPDGGVGTVWTNSTSGKMYVLTDATADANVWTELGAKVDPTFLVNPPDFASPDQTLSTDGTWSIGDVSADQLLWVYMVAGGSGVGSGGNYRFFVCKAGSLDGRSYTIGQGGVAQAAGTHSTFSLSGTTYSTGDSTRFSVFDGAMPTDVDTTYIDVAVYTPTITNTGSATNSKIFSGGSSPYVHYDGSASNSGLGYESLYAGSGGNSRVTHSNYSSSAAYNTGPQDGHVPGGAGGYAYPNGNASSGGNGNIRIYYV